jgi:hypothetical protein
MMARDSSPRIGRLVTNALGRDALREARVRREQQIAAVGAGLLCRETFFATAA